MGTVDGCGYNSQLKYTVYDACRPCHLILNILEPDKLVLSSRSGAYMSRSDNFSGDETLYPCACARGNKQYALLAACATMYEVLYIEGASAIARRLLT